MEQRLKSFKEQVEHMHKELKFFRMNAKFNHIDADLYTRMIALEFVSMAMNESSKKDVLNYVTSLIDALEIEKKSL